MVETTMMSGWGLCGKSRVCLKSRLHSVSKNVFILSSRTFYSRCYWAHLNPRRPYYRFQINSRMLRLKGERGCALASTQNGAWGRTDGRGLFPDPGPAPGKLSLAQTLSSTCRCPPGRFQQTPDYFKKGFQAGRLQEQSPALEQPRSCDSCLKCNLLLILMKCFLFVIKPYKIPALRWTLQI